MGYSTRNNGQIKDFWPDDTDDTVYFAGSVGLRDIIDMIQSKWPNADQSEIDITSEYIHTSCLTYDRYDSSDYTEFVVVTYTPYDKN